MAVRLWTVWQRNYFGCKTALTRRCKLSVFERKHAVNTLGLHVTAAVMHPVPEVATKLVLFSGPHVPESSKAIHRCSYGLHRWFRVCLPVCRFPLWLFSIIFHYSVWSCSSAWTVVKWKIWYLREIFPYTWLGSVCFLKVFVSSLCSVALYIVPDVHP